MESQNIALDPQNKMLSAGSGRGTKHGLLAHWLVL